VSEAVTEVTAPDAAADQNSFEAALAQATAIWRGDAAPTPTAAPAAVEPPTPAPAPAASTQSTPPAAPETPPPPSAKELERIAALDAREAKLRETEAKARALEERERALSEREARTVKQWEAFAADPVAAIRAMRPELSAPEAAQIAESLYFHALGDKAPPEHRQRQEVAKVKTEVSSEVEKLRAEIQELRESRARAEQEAQIGAYRSELRTGAAAVADAPIVANLVKRNPARAEEMLFEVARQAAIESAQAGATEPVVLTPAQAAAKLEAILKAQRDELFGDAPAAVTQPNVQQTTPSPSVSITNQDASIQPSRTSPDVRDAKALRRAALDAAGLTDVPAWDD
jgi:hypothetical protein